MTDGTAGRVLFPVLLLAAAACGDVIGADPLPTELNDNSTAPFVMGDGPPVLVGAGDIAECGSSADDATAALLDRIEGTVFVAGDNVYPDGTLRQYRLPETTSTTRAVRLATTTISARLRDRAAKAITATTWAAGTWSC